LSHEIKYNEKREVDGRSYLILQLRVGTRRRDSRLQRRKADGLTHNSICPHISGTMGEGPRTI